MTNLITVDRWAPLILGDRALARAGDDAVGAAPERLDSPCDGAFEVVAAFRLHQQRGYRTCVPQLKGYVHPVEVVAFLFACTIVAGILAFVAQLGRAAKRPSAEERL